MKNTKVQFEHLGKIAYPEAWSYQEKLHKSVVAAKRKNKQSEVKAPTPNFLLFCEHPHVYTLGKTGSLDHLLLTEEKLNALGATFHKINRGGDITYHGPGQLIGYPIFDLTNFEEDLHEQMRKMEEVIILALKQFGLQAGRVPDLTGVWLDCEDPKKARKICAMGIRCAQWVTMHGFSLNVNTDMRFFDYIVPCGIQDKGVTSLQRELGREVPMPEVEEAVRNAFLEVFGIQWK